MVAILSVKRMLGSCFIAAGGAAKIATAGATATGWPRCCLSAAERRLAPTLLRMFAPGAPRRFPVAVVADLRHFSTFTVDGEEEDDALVSPAARGFRLPEAQRAVPARRLRRL